MKKIKWFRKYWAFTKDSKLRARVNDKELSLHETFGHRFEAEANGLVLIEFPEDLFKLKSVSLYLEMWGGHPGTSRKKFILNGRREYQVEDSATADGHCTYTYQMISINVIDLVRGVNAFQFTCERGTSMWGHYIIDNAALIAELDPADLTLNRLENFNPEIKTIETDSAVSLELQGSEEFKAQINRVEYSGFYAGFNENGSEKSRSIHGYTQNRVKTAHLGSSDRDPYQIDWDISMLLSQAENVGILADIYFSEQTFAQIQNEFPLLNQKNIYLYYVREMPVPFWSRDNKLKTAIIDLDYNPTRILKAQLHLKIWDGGEGAVNTPFKLNGTPLSITSRKAIHDIYYSIIDIDPGILKEGENLIELLSDTEHHGIEILLPGPGLIVRVSE